MTVIKLIRGKEGSDYSDKASFLDEFSAWKNYAGAATAILITNLHKCLFLFRLGWRDNWNSRCAVIRPAGE